MEQHIIQHYAVWKRFNNKIYKSTLTSEDITNGGNEKYMDQVYKLRDGESKGTFEIEEGVPINTKCIFLEKGGMKYVLPSIYIKHLPLEVEKGFECYLKPSDKTIHTFITKPVTVGIPAQQTLTFRDLITLFNPVKHTEPDTWTFLKIQAIASKAKGCKFRLCSCPETGKNSNDIILHTIFNNNVKVSKGTLAKLETLLYYNQKILPDEMTSLTPAQVRDVEPLFLSIADEAPTMTKHSMAQKKDLNEVDISQTSCVFTYNDIASINPDSKFFDDIWQNKDAFNSRYPAFLIPGKVITTMPKLSMKQAETIMVEQFETLRLIARNIAYYTKHMSDELHHWSRTKLLLKGRHKVNFEGVIDGIDVYSSSQKEFDIWLDWVNKSAQGYQDMVVSAYQPVVYKVEEEVK